jgi:hypothetical protein
MTTVTQDQSKDTGLAIVLLLLVLMFAFQLYSLVPWAIGVQVLNMTAPQAFGPAAFVWFGFSRALGEIISRVAMAFVFFAVVTPVGAVRRMLGHDSLQLKTFKSGRESVMNQRDHTFNAGDLERPY